MALALRLFVLAFSVFSAWGGLSLLARHIEADGLKRQERDAAWTRELYEEQAYWALTFGYFDRDTLDSELASYLEIPLGDDGKLSEGARGSIAYLLGSQATSEGDQSSVQGLTGRLLGGPHTPSPELEARLSKVAAARELALATAQLADLSLELDSPMQFGRSYQVTLIVQGRENPGEPARGFAELQAEVPSQTQISETVSLGQELRANLSTADFEVSRGNQGWQVVVPESATVWDWTITPRSAGTKSILVVLEQAIRTDGAEYVLPVRTYPRLVEVEVSTWLWLQQASGWLAREWPPILLGVCGVLGGAVSLTQLVGMARGRSRFNNPSHTVVDRVSSDDEQGALGRSKGMEATAVDQESGDKERE